MDAYFTQGTAADPTCEPWASITGGLGGGWGGQRVAGMDAYGCSSGSGAGWGAEGPGDGAAHCKESHSMPTPTL